MKHRTHIVWFLIACFVLGCAKASEKKEVAGTDSGTTTKKKEDDRPHLYVILDQIPPVSNAQMGEKVIFNKVGSNFGNCYKPEEGTFECKEGFYDITTIVHWPGATSQREEFAICQVFLNMSGAPFPAAMATSPYLKGQPCTAQFTVKLYLKEKQKIWISAAVSATGGNLTPATYTYGYFIVTGEK